MMRISYRLYLLATALNYRLPRRLTKAGLLAAMGMVLAGAIGSDIDQSVAFESFALVLCLLGVAVGWTPLFRGRFSVTRALPRLASVDQPFRYRVEVRNLAPRLYRDLEVLEELADPRPTLAEFARLMRPVDQMRAFRLHRGSRPRLDFRQATIRPAPLPLLLPKAAVDAQLEVTPLRRGPLRFRALTIARRDPLGLVRSFVRMSLPQTVLVLPKRYRVPALAFPGTRQYQAGGVAMASSIGESEEFVSLRDYRPGDPFRRIHWRSWARAGRPIVKEYQDEFFVRQGLVLDTFAAPSQTDAFEEAVSVAASFACTLESQESLLDLLFVGTQAFCFTAGRGLGHSEQMLEILASVQPSTTRSFEGLRHLVLRHAPALSGCVCVFVQWDAARRELVQRLRERNLPVLVLLVTDESRGRGPDSDEAFGSAAEVHLLRPGKIAEDLQRLNAAPR